MTESRLGGCECRLVRGAQPSRFCASASCGDRRRARAPASSLSDHHGARGRVRGGAERVRRHAAARTSSPSSTTSPTIFNDLGRAQFQLALKDPGSPASPAAPSQANFITARRSTTSVHPLGRPQRRRRGRAVCVRRRRSPRPCRPDTDGRIHARAQPGQAGSAAAARWRSNGLVISTIAEVTFYGHDQTGREVSAVGNIEVSFANFGDPANRRGQRAAPATA